ncbi:ATP-dependent RNA helicase mtr4 [Diplonema papillatum]|nr:ATP-dependent RNA helicase mtr4 [Diplonema papillatum]
MAKRGRSPEGDEEADKKPKLAREPAITFPYELDKFQKDAVTSLEDGESVMVAAHTSAGKTTVAIYAIAMALRAKQRVIYTSPIKALSNQKYGELMERFDSVGLMTGDVTIKPEADCLVMTTEILRSMLYRGSEMLREVGCVIFDEVHYMRDKIRGVAWEETIILLPDKVQFVFLSATIPNSQEFAEWIMHIHPGKKCTCIYTDYRPTPLQHYVYPVGAEEIYMVVDEKSNFKESVFKRAMAAVGSKETTSAATTKGKGRKGGGDQSVHLAKIIKLIMANRLSPCIVFSFSKKECELYAQYMSKMDFNDNEEKMLVETIFNNAMEALGEDDRQLSAVTNLLPLLKRGVGIHHSGLLPILKEVVELLFGEGLIKVLFSTETFAMGLNMPSRTVVFTSVRKFDGEGTRWLTSGEYVQMSGRAGRRGIDTHGLAISMIDEAVPPDVIKGMTSGQADPLLSAFHLTFNMVLNVLRVEDIDPLYIMCRSFLQFQTDRGRPKLESDIKEVEGKIAQITIPHEEVVAEYFNAKAQLKRYAAEVRAIMTKPEHCLKFLQSGRIMRVETAAGVDYSWGVLLSCNAHEKMGDDGITVKTVYTMDVLVHVLNEVSRSTEQTADGRPPPCPANRPNSGVMEVLPFSLSELMEISTNRVFVPASLASAEARKKMLNTLHAARDANKGTFPILDPVKEMGIKSGTLTQSLKRLGILTNQVARNECHETTSPELIAALDRYQKRAALQGHTDELRKQLKSSKKVVLQKELKGMLRVLRRLEYTNKENIVRLKGRVATEISTSDENELLLCELLFANVFKTLSSNQISALLSTLVTTERNVEGWNPKEEFKEPLQLLYEIDKKIGEVMRESGLDVSDQETKIQPTLLDVTYAWMNGARFIDICSQTEVYEGSIIRMMRRLEELLRQLASATKVIGDEDLFSKFTEAIGRMKRDIVFANSLYL